MGHTGRMWSATVMLPRVVDVLHDMGCVVALQAAHACRWTSRVAGTLLRQAADVAL